MKKNLLLLSLLAAITMVGFNSCTQEKNNLNNVDYALLAEDASTSDNINNDVFKTVDAESRSGDYSSDVGKTGVYSWTSVVDTCAVVTLNTNGGTFPMTLTIDFGAGCTDIYGVTRKGKIIGVFSGRYTDQGTVVDVSFDGYYVNDHKVEGTKTITNNGRNGSNQLEFTVVDDLDIIKPSGGGTVQWNSTRLHVWTDGEATPLWICDDEYTISGTADGVASDGTEFGVRTQTGAPIVKTVCCPYIQSGTIIYSIQGTDVATLDFSTTLVAGVTGTCDATGTFTYNGQTIVVVVQ